MRALLHGILFSFICVLCLGQHASTAAAGAPEMTRVHNEGGGFLDPAFTEACGFDVEATLSQDLTIRTYPDGSRVAEVVTGRFALTLEANGQHGEIPRGGIRGH